MTEMGTEGHSPTCPRATAEVPFAKTRKSPCAQACSAGPAIGKVGEFVMPVMNTFGVLALELSRAMLLASSSKAPPSQVSHIRLAPSALSFATNTSRAPLLAPITSGKVEVAAGKPLTPDGAETE